MFESGFNLNIVSFTQPYWWKCVFSYTLDFCVPCLSLRHHNSWRTETTKTTSLGVTPICHTFCCAKGNIPFESDVFFLYPGGQSLPPQKLEWVNFAHLYCYVRSWGAWECSSNMKCWFRWGMSGNRTRLTCWARHPGHMVYSLGEETKGI